MKLLVTSLQVREEGQGNKDANEKEMTFSLDIFLGKGRKKVPFLEGQVQVSRGNIKSVELMTCRTSGYK